MITVIFAEFSAALGATGNPNTISAVKINVLLFTCVLVPSWIIYKGFEWSESGLHFRIISRPRFVIVTLRLRRRLSIEGREKEKRRKGWNYKEASFILVPSSLVTEQNRSEFHISIDKAVNIQMKLDSCLGVFFHLIFVLHWDAAFRPIFDHTSVPRPRRRS